MTNKSRNVRAGFTLIELLVVIAIIAILAAILFPALARARANARRSVCQSNLKQIGVVISMYTQDYDGVYPIGNMPSGLANGNQNWYTTVEPYIKAGYPANSGAAVGKQLSIWVCPDFEATNNKLGEPNPNDPVAIPAAGALPSRTYSINWNLAGWMGTGSSAATHPGQWRLPSNESALSNSSQTVLVSEGRGESSTSDGNDTNDFGAGNYPPSGDVNQFWKFQSGAVYVVGRTRHFDGANYLFADGHVKWVKAPTPTFQADGITPTVSTTGVVYRKSQYPNAAGWFRED